MEGWKKIRILVEKLKNKKLGRVRRMRKTIEFKQNNWEKVEFQKNWKKVEYLNKMLFQKNNWKSNNNNYMQLFS